MAQLLFAWKIEKEPDNQNYSVYKRQLYNPERKCPNFRQWQKSLSSSELIRFHLPGDIATQGTDDSTVCPDSLTLQGV
jgi:hypothetical protein